MKGAQRQKTRHDERPRRLVTRDKLRAGALADQPGQHAVGAAQQDLDAARRAFKLIEREHDGGHGDQTQGRGESGFEVPHALADRRQ